MPQGSFSYFERKGGTNMSRVFSRRSFLKYTALAAAAVAGSSLLSGCSNGYAPVQTAVQTSNKVLKVTSTLDSVSYDAASQTATFYLTITNGRANAVQIGRKNFAVVSDAVSYRAYNDSNIKVYNTSVDPIPNLQVKKGVTQTYTIKVFNFPGFDAGNTVRLSYWPDRKYVEYSSNWELGSSAFTSTTAAVDTYAQGLEV